MNLTGSQIKDTYEGVLNIGATGLTGTFQEITDGLGNLLNIQVSDTTINFSGIVTGNIIGTTGAAGTSGTSGTSGINGTSGTSGTSGVSGSSGTSGINGTSGTSGTSGVSGSSGTSGTSGINGATGPAGPTGDNGSSGVAGATGATGPAGATGAGASSPITLEQTNSLVSTAVGATATANCAISIGNNACSTGAGSVAIGNGAFASNTDAIGIGPVSSSGVGDILIGSGGNYTGSPYSVGVGRGLYLLLADYGINIGYGNALQGAYTIAIGNTYTGQTTRSMAEAAITLGNGNQNNQSYRGVVLGNLNCIDPATLQGIILGNSSCIADSSCSKIIGVCSQIFSGATGTIVLGNSSVGATGACNSVVIGNSSKALTSCSVVIGDTSCVLGNSNIAIGQNNICTTESYGISIGAFNCNTGACAITIGWCAHTVGGNRINAIAIGSDSQSAECSIAIGANTLGNGPYGVSLGHQARMNDTGSIAIGAFSCGFYPGIVSVGYNAGGPNARANSVNIGKDTLSCGYATIAIGATATSCAANAIAIGDFSCATHACSVALGSGVCTTRTNTTHVNSLVAYGQGASLTNAIGSAGATPTVDWDNGNNQSLTLTANITSLTLSNPIDGANYGLFITQGGVGNYTITWPASVKWPNATPPVITGAIGSVSAVSLIYIGTVYYGSFATNLA
jgi:hypothetical protein